MKENENTTKKIKVDIDKNQRLKEFYEYKGLTQDGFAKAIGASQQYISAVVNNKRNVGSNIINKIKNYFSDFNEYWFLTGKGDITTDPFLQNLKIKEPDIYPSIEDQIIKVVDKKKSKVDAVTPVSNESYMWVEYQDLATAAGVLGGESVADLPDVKKKLVPREYDSGNYLVVRVDGDSMDDGTKYSIPNGSEILIKEYNLNNGDTLPIRNNLFVIVSREGTVFKQIIKHVPDEYITCHSYNNKFKDFDITMEEIIQIFIYRKVVNTRPEIPDIL